MILGNQAVVPFAMEIIALNRQCPLNVCSPTSVIVLPIKLTTTSRLTRGHPRQLARMWQNIRCSILFHLRDSGGDGRPGSSDLSRRPASGVPIPMDAVFCTNGAMRWNDSACLASNPPCGLLWRSVVKGFNMIQKHRQIFGSVEIRSPEESI